MLNPIRILRRTRTAAYRYKDENIAVNNKQSDIRSTDIIATEATCKRQSTYCKVSSLWLDVMHDMEEGVSIPDYMPINKVSITFM
jgi:hypothetical protein